MGMNICKVALALWLCTQCITAFSEVAVVTQDTPPIPQASHSEPSDTVEYLLARAVTALHGQNYKGRFTYEFGNVLETLEVVHLVKDGIEHERILHLSGSKREFLRASSHDCLTVGSLLLLNPSWMTQQAGQLSDFYSFRIGAQERVAGRLATLVQIIPRDEFRYGYTIAFDEQSGLPLLSLLGSGQNTLERFQFVELTIGEGVIPSDLEPREGLYQTIAGERSENCMQQNRPEQLSSALKPDSWRVNWLPDGFVLSSVDHSGQFENVMTYTDGLAAFTVFVSEITPFGQQIDNGAARRGATLALISSAQFGNTAKNIAIVGEVPLATAKRVLSSIEPPP